MLIISASFGGGHRSAAGALEAHVEAEHPEWDVRTVDFFAEFVPGLEALARPAYLQLVRTLPRVYGSFFEMTDAQREHRILDEISHVGLGACQEYLEAYEPHAVISTFPVAGAVVADAKQTRPLVSATVITDFGAHRHWLHPGTDLYFVAADDVAEGLEERGVPPERVVVSGIPLREGFTRPLDGAECREALGVEERFTVLLSGSSDWADEICALAVELAEAGVQVLAPAGGRKRLHAKLEEAAARARLVHAFGYVEEMHRLVAASDVFLGKAGGLSVSEALAMGVPLVVLDPIPGQEYFNVDFLVNHGAGLAARDADDAVAKARFLRTHPARHAELAAAARRLGRPEATERVVARVLEATG
jgi:processive 1,2-diacylglycerol beta-glucosyltransferase